MLTLLGDFIASVLIRRATALYQDFAKCRGMARDGKGEIQAVKATECQEVEDPGFQQLKSEKQNIRSFLIPIHSELRVACAQASV